MAVKQNNSDKNDDGNETTIGKMKTSGGGGGGGGLGNSGKSKKPNKNDESMMVDGIGAGVAGPGGGGGGVGLGSNGLHHYNQKSLNKSTTKQQLQQYQLQYQHQQYIMDAMANDETMIPLSMNFNVTGKRNDINFILRIIDKIEMRQQQSIMQELPKVYFQLLQHLAKVQVPFQSAEDIKYFNEGIAKVGEFFSKVHDKVIYNYYLFVVCQLITSNGGVDGKPPSCALAIIFQLFDSDMISDAVNNLLQHNISDANIRYTINLLCDWLSICSFCPNLNIWIMEILNGLRGLKKFILYEQIALDNIEKLFSKVIVPIFRPKVAPVVLHMLINVNHTPTAFHKIVPHFPRVLQQLKQQVNNGPIHDSEDSTKQVLKQFMKVAVALMTRYDGYDNLYDQLENCVKMIQLSVCYMPNNIENDGGDINSQQSNAIECRSSTALSTTSSFTNAKVGLVNLGNTCYMNSVLQALAMTKEFSREILLLQSKSPLIIKMQQQIALMLYSIRQELTPSKVLNATRPPGFAPGVQQDSSEFLGHLLESLHVQELQYMKYSKSTTNATTTMTALTRTNSVEYTSSLRCTRSSTKAALRTTTSIPTVSEMLNQRNQNNTFFGCPIEPKKKNLMELRGSDDDNAMIIDDEEEREAEEKQVCDDADEMGQHDVMIDQTDKGEEEKKQPPHFIGPNQHTSEECKMEEDDDDCMEEANKTNNEGKQNASVTSLNESQLKEKKLKPISTIEKTFTGLLTTTYKCLTCGWKSHNMDNFRDLQLSFPDVKNDCASNYSVQDLIEYYCSPEKLDGENQYFCDRCKNLSDAERYISVVKAPKNMILTLKHFKYDQKHHMRAKLMHKVFHDEKVSVKICCPQTLDEVATVHYDLYAGVVHSGFSMDSGHYYTFAADSSNNWYKFNDDIVTPSKTEELHNLSPPNTLYILFYEMAGRSNEPAMNEMSPLAASTAKEIKIDVPKPLSLDELPLPLKDMVALDNYTFREELCMRRQKNATLSARNQGENDGSNSTNRGCDHYFDEDEDEPPPVGGGCGSNMLNVNTNRFIC